MNTLYADYSNGLINVISSIEKYYGLIPKHKTNKIIDDILRKKQYKNIILMLYDGFGYNILKRNEKITPNLNKYLKEKITSCFPSTTMSSRTTIESGLTPIEHGWIGWNMYFKDFDNVITISKNNIKDTKVKAADYHVAKKYLKYESVVEKLNKKTDVNAKKITVYKSHKNESLKKSIGIIKESLDNELKNFIYFYSNEPDYTFHRFGAYSFFGKLEMKKADKHFKILCDCLSDTLIIALSDHGHINTSYITLSDYPKLYSMLKSDISIDCRCVSFRVKDGFKNEFLHELKSVLKDDFIILSKKEVIDKKLFGTGKENKYFNDALGDYIAVAVGDKSIRYNENSRTKKSSHSGITEDEMYVPLIIYEG